MLLALLDPEECKMRKHRKLKRRVYFCKVCTLWFMKQSQLIQSFLMSRAQTMCGMLTRMISLESMDFVFMHALMSKKYVGDHNIIIYYYVSFVVS